MNRFYLVVCFINIFAFSVRSAPTKVTNIFDLIQNYSAKNCTVLNKNVLVDKNMSYLARCSDVSLDKVPADVGFDSMNAYLCVAVFDAEYRLCNAIANESYTELPKSFKDLREIVENIRNNSADKVCDKFNNFTSAYNYSSDIAVKPWMSKFNAQLFGTGCSFLCSDIGRKTNVFCSLLYYINLQILRVENAIQQRKIKVVPDISSIASTVVKSTTIKNVKSDSAAPVVPNVQQTTIIVKNIPAEPQIKSVVVKQITNIAVTPTTTTTTPTTTENNLVMQPRDPVGDDKKIDSQLVQDGQNAVAKSKAELVQDGQNAVAKSKTELVQVGQNAVTKSKTEPVQDSQNVVTNAPAESVESPRQPVVPVEQVKAPEITKEETVADQSVAMVPNNAPETENTAVENKLDTPETNEEPEAANKNTAIVVEPADVNVDTEIFNTPGPAEPKDLKPDNTLYDDDDVDNIKLEDDVPGLDKEQESVVPVISEQSVGPRDYADVEDSNFFAYFMFISVMFIAGYVVYHNKQKILALVLEGRRDRNARRRPNTASYRKLNSNLEEAVTSKCSGSAAHVIY